MGATHLWKPLKMIQMLTSGEQPRNIFLFSDGHITDESQTIASIQKHQQKLRLFTFGLRWVGYIA